MNTDTFKKQLRNKLIKRIILFFIIGQFVVCATAMGDLINITGAEQQLEGQTGWKIGGEPSNDIDQFVPGSPQGPTDAILNLSFANFGVSIAASLDSLFSEDQITASSSGAASAVWGTQPDEADDIHGGGASTFSLSFTGNSSPVYFYVDGKINYSIEGATGDNDHPEREVADVRLSTDNGDTIVWEEAILEENGDMSIAFAHGIWLESGKTYLLEAYAGAGVGITPEKTSIDPQLNSASFSFTATASAVSIDIVQDTISNKTKTITCDIWPPYGYDVTEINPDSIWLSDGLNEVQPDRISFRQKQQMLVVNFPTSGLDLQPGPDPLELSVRGELTDGTPFEASDFVTVERKGGKPISPSPTGVTGTVTYTGAMGPVSASRPIIVMMNPFPDEFDNFVANGSTYQMVSLTTSPGTFTFTNVPPGQYHLLVCLDANNDGVPSNGEPCEIYTPGNEAGSNYHTDPATEFTVIAGQMYTASPNITFNDDMRVGD